jgi:dynein assembly factor 3
VQIYVVENKMEHLARQLLQWHIALDEGLELREREQIFLEVFGNCHLRGKTAVYVEEHIDELIRLVLAPAPSVLWRGRV